MIKPGEALTPCGAAMAGLMSPMGGWPRADRPRQGARPDPGWAPPQTARRNQNSDGRIWRRAKTTLVQAYELSLHPLDKTPLLDGINPGFGRAVHLQMA